MTNKYNARKKTIDGIQFDSIAESKRYQELKLLERAGLIKTISVHKKYGIQVNEVHICNYFADFYYFNIEQDKYVVEDVKSAPTRTSVYRLKKKLMQAVFGIEISEVE